MDTNRHGTFTWLDNQRMDEGERGRYGIQYGVPECLIDRYMVDDEGYFDLFKMPSLLKTTKKGGRKR